METAEKLIGGKLPELLAQGLVMGGDLGAIALGCFSDVLQPLAQRRARRELVAVELDLSGVA